MLAFLFVFVSLGRLYRNMLREPETRGLLIMAGLIMAIGVVFYMNVEHWSLVDSIYFCVVTLATVGYGDITPATQAGRIFTIFYIIFGIAIVGGFFATAGRMFQPGRFLRRGEAAVDKELERNASEEEAKLEQNPSPDEKPETGKGDKQ